MMLALFDQDRNQEYPRCEEHFYCWQWPVFMWRLDVTAKTPRDPPRKQRPMRVGPMRGGPMHHRPYSFKLCAQRVCEAGARLAS